MRMDVDGREEKETNTEAKADGQCDSREKGTCLNDGLSQKRWTIGPES